MVFYTSANQGEKHGLPPHHIAKAPEVFAYGARALEICHRNGVQLVYGTDLLGTMHDRIPAWPRGDFSLPFTANPRQAVGHCLRSVQVADRKTAR